MKKIKYFELQDNLKDLVEKALTARLNAYAPLSNFKVGAALIDETDKIHTGCNVESADYTLTTHAEMLAVDSMALSGARLVKKIAIVHKSDNGLPLPCGLCRQKIYEFANKEDVQVIGVNLGKDEQISEIYLTSLKELYPFAFGKENLNLGS